ncbi:MAG: glycosyl hydrolase family 28-related protein, partial [Bacillus sp. (in: firmicutes)]
MISRERNYQNRVLKHWLYGMLIFFIMIIIFIVGNKIAEPGQVGSLNVREFGAKGNGEADDTNAIQKALNMAKTSKTPVRVVVPAGTYKLTRILRIYGDT